MSETRTPRAVLLALVFVMAGAAFALGIGVKGLIEDDNVVAARVIRTPDGVVVPAPVVRASDIDSDTDFSLLDEVYSILDREFVDPSRVDLERLRTAAINGIVASLNDPHSVFIDEETFRLSSEDISGEFEGIGATVNLVGESIVISGVFRGSPAEASGVRSGDVILEVEGESTAGWTLQAAVARIRGESGTDVNILVRHRNDVEELITITRDRIIVPSVLSLPVDDREGNPVTDIGYVIISQYTERTRGEIEEFVDTVTAAGLTQLIIDLRGNPGGLLSATVETTGEFLDGGLVLTEVDREGGTRDFNDVRGGSGIGLEIVLLVDAGSASGSEVMASALRDHGRAVIIGEQTFGKGTVNVPRALTDGSVLYVSIARWLSPNGDLIEGIGVIPDIIVEPTDEDFELQRDVQLFTAVELLRGRQDGSQPATPEPPDTFEN